MAWTKIPKEHHPIFEAAVPQHKAVSTIKMFGGIAAMAGGHMMGGLWAKTVVVRLGDKDRKKVLAMKGGKDFDPMGRGKPMADMVLLPASILKDGRGLRRWLDKALAFTLTLPPKKKKKKKASKNRMKVAKAPARKTTRKKPAKKKTTKKTTAPKKTTKKTTKKKATKKTTVRKKTAKKKATVRKKTAKKKATVRKK